MLTSSSCDVSYRTTRGVWPLSKISANRILPLAIDSNFFSTAGSWQNGSRPGHAHTDTHSLSHVNLNGCGGELRRIKQGRVLFSKPRSFLILITGLLDVLMMYVCVSQTHLLVYTWSPGREVWKTSRAAQTLWFCWSLLRTHDRHSTPMEPRTKNAGITNISATSIIFANSYGFLS